MIFPLQLLLDLLGASPVRAHESQQPLLQVGRRAETERTDVNPTGAKGKTHTGLYDVMRVQMSSDEQKSTLDFTACIMHIVVYLAGPSDDGLNWEFLSRKSRRPRSSRITNSRSKRLTLLSSCTKNNQKNTKQEKCALKR